MGTINIGLTGGIGCGKSEALRFFAEAGVETVETDSVVRELMITDADLITSVGEAFGPEVLDREGKIDRGKLAGRVFGSSTALSLLESLVHPRVRDHWMRKLRETHPVLIVEIPLLFEKDLQGHFTFTICVSSHPEVQRQRLLTRGMTESQIQYRKQHQLDLDEKMRRSDIVLYNNGTTGHLREQVQWILRNLETG